MRKFNKGSNILSVLLVLGFLCLIFVIATGGFRDLGPAVKSASALAIAADLSTADNFSVLAALSMAANGTGTTISGDLGLSPGLAVSRTGTWNVGGTEYFGPSSLAFNAQADALNAFNDLASQLSDGVWASSSPVPGVYDIALDTTFAGPTLTLDGDFNDVWVFQIGQDMTFTGNVVLAGNAQACNVFWQIGRDATITAGSQFAGTLIASRDVTVASGATVNGRIISLTSSAVFESGNTVSGPTCAVAPATGTINVVKIVTNDDGGTQTIADFPLFVNGVPVASGATTVFPASSTYTVTETTSPQYTQTFSGVGCTGGVVNLSQGDVVVCTITNDDIAVPPSPPSSSGGGGSRRTTPLVPPLIDVVKVPTPLALPDGPGSVTYTYTLRNIGEVAVEDITMVGDTCSPIVLVPATPIMITGLI